MLRNNLLYVAELHFSVENSLGIYDHYGTMFTQLAAAGALSPHINGKPLIFHDLLEFRGKSRAMFFAARYPRPRRALVGADKDVLLIDHLAAILIAA
jgi:hypothetical protein